MKKQTFHIIGFLFFLLIVAPACTVGKSFDKKKAAQLIIGQWQQTDLSVTCDQIQGFNEAMSNPATRSSFETISNSTSLQFDAGGKVISNIFSTITTSTYQISDDGYFTIYSNLKKRLPEKARILELTSDTFIYTKTRKMNDPDLAGLMSVLHVENDTAKTITYKYTYSKIKEANAPWTLIKNNLPKKRWVESLAYNDSTFFTIVSNPSSQHNDSIYTSNNYCANWHYGGYAISKSNLGNGKMMDKEGSKVFVETEKSVFATENRGKSWIEIKGLPTSSFGIGLPQFATTDSRIYSGFGSELFASGDNGTTWAPVKTPLQNEDNIMTLAASGNDIIISGLGASMDPGAQPNARGPFLLLSEDGGQHWKNIQVASYDYPGIMTDYLVIAGSSIIMDTQYGMFRSDLQHINWTLIKGLSVTPVNNAFTPHTPTGSAGEAIIASGTNIFYGGASGMFVSNSGGESWTEVNNTALRKGINSFVIVNDQIIALTAESKLFQASVKDLVQYMKKMGE